MQVIQRAASLSSATRCPISYVVSNASAYTYADDIDLLRQPCRKLLRPRHQDSNRLVQLYRPRIVLYADAKNCAGS